MANGTLKVSNIETSSGSGTITIGASGETVDLSNGTITGITQGVTEGDFFRTNANTSVSGGTDTLITAWARNTQGVKVGTGMSVSSGIWTFPSTGIYLITTELQYNASTSSRYIFTSIQKTSNNSSYTELAKGYANINRASSTWWAGAGLSVIFDCTDTTNDKIKIYAKSENATEASGGTDDFSLGRAVFTRIGDT